MIIRKEYTKFLVFEDTSLLDTLKKVSTNRHRIVFVVNENGLLTGSLSDGDVRRWLLSSETTNLDVPVSHVMKRDCIFARIDEPAAAIEQRLGQAIFALPLLDENSRVVGIALQGSDDIDLGGKVIGPDTPTFIIAEIGNNHNGSLEQAIRLIDLAAEAGADCAKFQMRDMDTMYRASDNSQEDLGAQYTLDLLKRFQLSDDELFKAFDHCSARGMVPLCTPWDKASLQKLDEYGLPGFKIASADFTNHDLLDAAIALSKPIICSTGMTNENEIIKGVDLLKNSHCPFVLLHCNSTYPTPDKDVNLSYLEHLRKLSDGIVGYSGHERGIAVPLAAVALGARVVEKHLTTDRGLEGNDHKVSLLPDEFEQMVKSIRQVEAAMGKRGERLMSQGELMNRETLAKSLIAKTDIPVGTLIKEHMLDVRSPGQGLQPHRKHDLIGKVLSEAKVAGDFFYESDLESNSVTPRNYEFSNPWGIPVRYHDLQNLRRMSNMDMLEIHLSYKDLELNFQDFIAEPLDLDLVVHAPELFAGDHTLDLCSADPEYRARSILELQRVIDLTRELTPFFKRAKTPPIVTNVGGFTHSAALSEDKRLALYAEIEDSLSKLDSQGVELLPQTMPPFPWHFGGQQFHNIFMDPKEIRDFCERNEMRVCLDVSHSKLACTHLSISLSRFLELVAPYTAHYHLADAKGVDGEGLQISDGEIDWEQVLFMMRKFSPAASFIPEIWQGHKNNGEGAWLAMQRLEAFHKGLTVA